MSMPIPEQVCVEIRNRLEAEGVVLMVFHGDRRYSVNCVMNKPSMSEAVFVLRRVASKLSSMEIDDGKQQEFKL